MHYHIFMDESGNFEGKGSKITALRPILFAVLVPEINQEGLSKKVKQLWLKHSISASELHAMTAKGLRKPEYLAELVSCLKEYKAISFILQYQEDVMQHLPDELQEAFAANRFLSMANTLFEHILYLHPPFFKNNLDFSLRPNSRVIPLEINQKHKIKQMKDFGYHSLNIGGKEIFFIWNADALRTNVLQHALDYSPWTESIGSRSFLKFETIIAVKTDNPLAHMVDHLAYLCRAEVRGEKKLEAVNTELRQISVCLDYDQNFRQYRDLAREYHSGNVDEFFPDALQFFAKTTDSYYQSAINLMLENSLSRITLKDISQLEKLEQLAGEYLRTSRGNWEFVLDLLQRLIAAAQTWPDTLRCSDRCQWLLLRLYSHKLSIHNHRGEDADARECHDAINKLPLDKLSVDNFRELISIENRVAVTMSNVFAFEQAIKKINPLITTLEISLNAFKKLSDSTLYDPLLGKLRGTIAQNMAFLAPKKPSLFREAESLFIEAAQEFTYDRDRIRHDINLLHLYIDWEKYDAAEKRINIIKKYHAVSAFLQKPSNITARYMQFVLSALLKYCIAKKKYYADWLMRCPLSELKQWFKEAANEHPFEFIYGYLGRMAYFEKKYKEARQYFEHALKIPSTGDPREQSTLQVIRAQIWVWWAFEEEQVGKRSSAAEKMKQAHEIMQKIGTTKCLETMLCLEQNGTSSGWFAQGWQALDRVNWQDNFNRDTCTAFLRNFTFNYC